MRVLLVCSSGLSTSLLVENMNNFADEFDVIDAVPFVELADSIELYDLVLVGPHLKIKMRMVEKICKNYGKKAMLIDDSDYQSINGGSVYAKAKAYLEQD